MCIVRYVLKGFQKCFVHPEGSSLNYDLFEDISPHLPFTVAVIEELYFQHIPTYSNIFLGMVMKDNSNINSFLLATDTWTENNRVLEKWHIFWIS